MLLNKTTFVWFYNTLPTSSALTDDALFTKKHAERAGVDVKKMHLHRGES